MIQELKYIRNRIGHLEDAFAAIGIPDGRLITERRSPKQVEAALNQILKQVDKIWAEMDNLIVEIDDQR